MKVTLLYRVRGYHIELSIYSIKFRGDYRSKMKNTQWGYWWSYSRMVRGWCILLLKIGIAFSFCTSGSGFICILDQAYGSLLYQDQPTWYFCLSRWSLCQHPGSSPDRAHIPCTMGESLLQQPRFNFCHGFVFPVLCSLYHVLLDFVFLTTLDYLLLPDQFHLSLISLTCV